MWMAPSTALLATCDSSFGARELPPPEPYFILYVRDDHSRRRSQEKSSPAPQQAVASTPETSLARVDLGASTTP